MTASPGRFVVFEGLDGAGTSTQVAKLAELLAALGIDHVTTFEPWTSLPGRLARDAIETKVGFDHHLTLPLLFAADRAEHLATCVGPALDAGRWVICDRFLLSSLAYQLSDAAPADWLRTVNRAALDAPPDVTIFVDTPVDECVRRIQQRDAQVGGEASADLFHGREALERVARNYGVALAGDLRDLGPVVTIDGRPGHGAVAEAVEQVLRSMFGDELPARSASGTA